MALKFLIITQARTTSTRLPEKVLKTINGKTLLEIHLNRILKVKHDFTLVLATTTNTEDDKIKSLGESLNIQTFRGAEDDVLDRFYQASKNIDCDYVVRLTSDCPLIDSQLIDQLFDIVIQNPKIDYLSNTIGETYPDGQDIEIFKKQTLTLAWENAHLGSEREHVTLYIRNHPELFEIMGVDFINNNFKNIRMTVDELEDFILIEKLIMQYGINKDWQFYADKIIEENLASINNKHTRNEGLKKSLKEDLNDK